MGGAAGVVEIVSTLLPFCGIESIGVAVGVMAVLDSWQGGQKM